jgi:hypothetical protein
VAPPSYIEQNSVHLVLPEVKSAQVPSQFEQLGSDGSVRDLWRDGEDDEPVAVAAPCPLLPGTTIILDSRPDVIIATLEVVLGQQAVSKSVLLRLHLAEETRLRGAEPCVQGPLHFLATGVGPEQDVVALSHVRGERVVVTPGVLRQVLDQVTDHPGNHLMFRSPQSRPPSRG